LSRARLQHQWHLFLLFGGKRKEVFDQDQQQVRRSALFPNRAAHEPDLVLAPPQPIDLFLSPVLPWRKGFPETRDLAVQIQPVD
jgi:hypothetical protein